MAIDLPRHAGGAAAVLLVCYLGAAGLNNPRGFLGTDTGAKVATLAEVSFEIQIQIQHIFRIAGLLYYQRENAFPDGIANDDSLDSLLDDIEEKEEEEEEDP